MSVEHLFLTDKIVAGLPLAADKTYRARDSEVAGFFVSVGKRRKSFMAEGERWKNGVRELRAQTKLGAFGDLSTREARAKAKEFLGQIAKGERPGDEPKTKDVGFTLRAAWERYRDAHMIRKGLSPKTIASCRDHIERLMADWLDQPLAELGNQPILVVERHEKITRDNGPYMANGSMRTLRAIYNHARRSRPELPLANPVLAVDWNREERRNTGMGEQQVGKWLEDLQRLDNPLRREFHLFLLLSGCRPGAAKSIRLEHVDWHRRLLHVPKPKGGAKRAFDIPLSRPMIRCLIRAMRLGRIIYPEQSEVWLFPAASHLGHIVEHKEARKDLAKWGNDLRQSFRTLAQVAEVGTLDIHLLMNHSLPGVNAGYITRDQLLGGHLRRQQEKISDLVVRAGRAQSARIGDWLRTCRPLPFEGSIKSLAKF